MTALANSQNVQLGLNFLKNKPLARELEKFAHFLTAKLERHTFVSASLVQRGSEVFSLIEVIARNRPVNEVRMQIEFWPDGMIVLRDNTFKTGEELGLTFPTAPIPVNDYIEYSDIDQLIDQLQGINTTESWHRFVSAETLLLEDDDRAEPHRIIE